MKQYRYQALAAFVVAILLVVAVWLFGIYQTKDVELQITTIWSEADDAFRQANYDDAQTSYGKLVSILQTHREVSADNESKQELELAVFMERLSQAGHSFQQITEQQGQLDSFYSELHDLDQKYGHLQDAHSDFPSDEEYPIGLSFPLNDRWELLVNKIYEHETKLSQKISESASPTREELQRLSLTVRFVQEFSNTRDAQSLGDALQLAKKQVAIRDLIDEFQQVSLKASKSLNASDIDRAKYLWRSIQHKYGSQIQQHPGQLGFASTDYWNQHLDRLRLALKNAVRSQEKPAVTELVGAINLRSPPILPVQEFTALVKCSSVPQSRQSGEYVYAQVEDRCYALDGLSGQPLWVLRTGYDVPALPQAIKLERETSLIIPWKNETGFALTVANTALETKWTWQLPPDEAFSGPPLIDGSSVYCSLRSGSLVQLDLMTGQPLNLMRVPSRFAGPLHVSEAGPEAVIAAEDRGIYFFQLGDQLTLTDLLMADSDVGVVNTCALWLRPFAILFANNLKSNCQMSVYYQDNNNEFRHVATEEIEGRVWAPPEINGTRFLVLSDQGTEIEYGLRTNDLTKPVFKTFQNSASRWESPVMPFTASTFESPFIAALGAEVISYNLNRVPSEIERPRETQWEYEAKDQTTVPTQPLQTTTNGVVVVSRNQNDVSTHVKSIDYQTGEVQWKTSLGAQVSQWSVLEETDSDREMIVAITADYDFFHIQLRDTEWNCRLLGDQKANDSVVIYDGEYRAAVWSRHNESRLNRWLFQTTSPQVRDIAAPLASPLSIIKEGTMYKTGRGGESQTLTGLWLAWIDVTLAIHLENFAADNNQIQFARVNNSSLPIKAWYPPLMTGEDEIIVAHPQGHLVMAELRQDQGVPFLYITAERQLVGGMIQSPILHQDHLWVIGQDGYCRSIEVKTLKTKRRILLPSQTLQAVFHNNELYLALQDGSLAMVKTNAEVNRDGPDRISEISSTPLMHLAVDTRRNRILAVDRTGKLFAISLSLDSNSMIAVLPSPSVAPLIVKDSLLYADIEGRVQRLKLEPTSTNNGTR